MSILAERRRRTKWTLNPGRQALWNKADSYGIKFGQGLMEKMGWKVGQGLGVNEQGMKEPLMISIKNDSKGIGFKENDNVWIQQQHEFNELLGKLSTSNNTDEENVNKKKRTDHTRTSLEEKSRHSKTRVHYQKFTRGKDLSRYSEKDLKCILGSKNDPFNDVVKPRDSIGFCSQFENTATISHGGSMVDYFMQKMQNKAIARSMNFLHCGNKQKDIVMDCENDFGGSEQTSVKVKQKSPKNENETKCCKPLTDIKITDEICEDVECNETANVSKETIVERQIKNNKRKKLNELYINDCSQDSHDKNNEEKNNEIIKNITSVNDSADNIECKSKSKTKKGNRNEKLVEESNSGFNNQFDSGEIILQKKRKRKEMNVDYPEVLNSRKKHKTRELEKNSVISDACIDFERHRKIKKKKEKSKGEIIIEKDGVKSEKIDIKNKNFISCREGKDKMSNSKGSAYDFAAGTSEISAPGGNFEDRKGKKKFLKKESDTSKLKVLMCCANVDKFHGSNVGQLKGYGFLKLHKR